MRVDPHGAALDRVRVPVGRSGRRRATRAERERPGDARLLPRQYRHSCIQGAQPALIAAQDVCVRRALSGCLGSAVPLPGTCAAPRVASRIRL
jgi:hypothetical protein